MIGTGVCPPRVPFHSVLPWMTLDRVESGVSMTVAATTATLCTCIVLEGCCCCCCCICYCFAWSARSNCTSHLTQFSSLPLTLSTCCCWRSGNVNKCERMRSSRLALHTSPHFSTLSCIQVCCSNVGACMILHSKSWLCIGWRRRRLGSGVICFWHFDWLRGCIFAFDRPLSSQLQVFPLTFLSKCRKYFILFLFVFVSKNCKRGNSQAIYLK